LLFLLAIARLAFIPLYLLCNIGGRGSAISSDFFYLFVVQIFFGVSNGYIGSNCMMGFVEWVDPEEREAAGGFMSLCLVAGLTAGSFLSFLAAGA
jgi:equilibrative nucleoside transporter 1/2/3